MIFLFSSSSSSSFIQNCKVFVVIPKIKNNSNTEKLNGLTKYCRVVI